MSLTKIKVIRELVLSWKAFGMHGWYLPASAVLDILFFVAYGFMTAPVFARLTEHVIVIGTLLSGQMQAVGGARPAVIDVLFQPLVSKYTYQFIGLLVILALVVFALFCVLQGLAWHIAGRISGSKTGWRQFLMHFARINLLWGSIYFLWHCVSMVFELRALAIEKVMGQPVPQSGFMLSIALVVMAYFAFVSYPLLSIRRAFSLGVKRIAVVAPAFIIVAAQLFVGNFVVKQLASASAKLSFIAGVILLIVLLAWSRAYVTFVVRRAANV